MVLGQTKYLRKKNFHIVLLFYKTTASIFYSILSLNGRVDGTLELNSKIISSQLLRIPSRRLDRIV